MSSKEKFQVQGVVTDDLHDNQRIKMGEFAVFPLNPFIWPLFP